MYGQKPYAVVPYGNLILKGSAAAGGPFAQYDWSKAVNIGVMPFHPYVYRQHLLTNPIPFAQYNWPDTNPIRLSVSHQYVYNPNLFKNPFPPFSSDADWSKPIRVRQGTPHQFVYNPNLFTSAPAVPPFSQSFWPHTRAIKGYTALSDQGIWAFEIPFAQYDWSDTSSSLKPSQPHPYTLNLNLYQVVSTTKPFNQTDWPQTKTVKGNTALSDQGIWAFEIPLAQFDVSRPGGFRYFKPAQIDGAIIDITQPFAQYDWSKPQIVRSAVPHQYVYNQNLFSAPVAGPPFFKTDWSKPFWPIPSKSRDATLNLCLYSNPIPFAQYDWSKPFRVPVDRGSQVGVNLNLFKNPIPFFNPASTVTNSIRFTSVPQTVNFQLLNAIPVVVTVSFDPFVKKRSKPKRQRDRLRDELEIKYKRRLAIEEAFWPPTTYELPDYKLPLNVKPAPDVSDLANVIMQVHAMRAKQRDMDDEEDLMKLLREEYGIKDV